MTTCEGCGAGYDTGGIEVLACESCPPSACDQCGVVAVPGECPCWIDLGTPADAKWAAALLGFNVEGEGSWVR